MALRKTKGDAVAAFVKKRGHLFATPPENLAGAGCTTFWDYQDVPLKVGITDLRGRKVTFTCNNYLQVINLAIAHYLTRTREFKRRFGRFDPTRVNLVYRSGEGWLKRPLEGYIGYRHTELIIAYALRGDGRDDDNAPAPPPTPSPTRRGPGRARGRREGEPRHEGVGFPNR